MHILVPNFGMYWDVSGNQFILWREFSLILTKVFVLRVIV